MINHYYAINHLSKNFDKLSAPTIITTMPRISHEKCKISCYPQPLLHIWQFTGKISRDFSAVEWRVLF